MLTEDQAVRNAQDLNCMSVPWKYRYLGDFHPYYSGEKRAPVLTLVIGGNHEAANYFSELYYGGWLAPNIYYLGAVNVLRYGPLRIAGISGIFNRGSYAKPHHERLPYDRDELRSIYHVRECDISKLLQVRSPVHIGISHDWPRRVEWFGDYQQLFASRPHFFESAKVDNLGSAPAEQVMHHLRPRYWFSGHMHVRYAAEVEHSVTAAADMFNRLAVSEHVQAQLPRSMSRMAFRSRKGASTPSSPIATNTITHFLALDKPGPDREYLELLEIDSGTVAKHELTSPYMQKTPQGKFVPYYDEEWLSILRASGESLISRDSTSVAKSFQLESGSAYQAFSDIRWVQANITAKGLLKIPNNFERHAPVHNANKQLKADEQPCEYSNTQTEAFCQMLQIRNTSQPRQEPDTDSGNIVFE
jgi:lariat debranching enzyme